MVAILGARQVGKTTLVREIVWDAPRVAYFDLERHPKVGASWEGFALAALVERLGARPEECYFWRTHAGAELDLLVVRGRVRRGFEIKRTTAPAVTPSLSSALADLGLDSLDVVCAADRVFPLAERIRAVPLKSVLTDVAPLR